MEKENGRETRGEMQWKGQGEILVRKEKGEEKSQRAPGEDPEGWRRQGQSLAAGAGGRGGRRQAREPPRSRLASPSELTRTLETEVAIPENPARDNAQLTMRQVLQCVGLQTPRAASRPKKSSRA